MKDIWIISTIWNKQAYRLDLRNIAQKYLEYYLIQCHLDNSGISILAGRNMDLKHQISNESYKKGIYKRYMWFIKGSLNNRPYKQFT